MAVELKGEKIYDSRFFFASFSFRSKEIKIKTGTNDRNSATAPAEIEKSRERERAHFMLNCHMTIINVCL